MVEMYRSDGSRSFRRLCKWAGLLESDDDVEDEIYKKFSGVLQVNSSRLLRYWIKYIEKNQKPTSNIERLMRNMLYYSFYGKTPEKEGFASIAEGIDSIVKQDFVKDELLQVLHYNLKHIDFVAKENEYSFECPLDVHCNYSTRQILAAFDYYNEKQAPDFREGVKFFDAKNTDVFLINLNKSEKDFSPSTMYEDYAISETLFHWQTQSGLSNTSKTAKRYVEHDKMNTNVSLFVREHKKTLSHTSSFVFLGNADYVSHKGSKPISFVWKLHEPIPAKLLEKANKSVAI